MLNKEAVVRSLAAEQGITLRQSGEIYDTIISKLVGSLNEGTQVRLAGFGTLKVVDVGPRSVRSPRTGEVMNLPARKRVRFVPSAGLKRSVNGQ